MASLRVKGQGSWHHGNHRKATTKAGATFATDHQSVNDRFIWQIIEFLFVRSSFSKRKRARNSFYICQTEQTLRVG